MSEEFNFTEKDFSLSYEECIDILKEHLKCMVTHYGWRQHEYDSSLQPVTECSVEEDAPSLAEELRWNYGLINAYCYDGDKKITLDNAENIEHIARLLERIMYNSEHEEMIE